jgi:hypothetical protein
MGFSPPLAPNYDTGLMAVPTGLTVVTAGSPWIMGMLFSNPTAASITVLVTNTAGDAIIPTVEVPAGMDIPRAYPFIPCVGLKWQASGAGLKGQIWGYL